MSYELQPKPQFLQPLLESLSGNYNISFQTFLNLFSLPHVIMNISTLVHVPVEKVFLRMQCLHASDMSDVYCHQPEVLIDFVDDETTRGSGDMGFSRQLEQL